MCQKIIWPCLVSTRPCLLLASVGPWERPFPEFLSPHLPNGTIAPCPGQGSGTRGQELPATASQAGSSSHSCLFGAPDSVSGGASGSAGARGPGQPSGQAARPAVPYAAGSPTEVGRKEALQHASTQHLRIDLTWTTRLRGRG